MTFGTRVGVTTGTGAVAMTTSVDRADPDGTAAVQVTVVGSADPVASVTTVGPVTTVDPATMAEATTAEAAATAKPLSAQVTVAAPWVRVT